jgi:site-specific DNA recombinase
MARRAPTRAVANAAQAGLRVAIYIRRSTDEEHQPFSLEAQESRLRAYIRSQPGWSLVASFDDDASGAKLDRPGLHKALTAARAGRFDILLVYRVDRFTRRIRDLVTLLDELDTAGVVFRSATEPFDTSTPAGRMLVQMLGVFAEFEREMIIDRVVNGMERKASKGKWTLGTAPYGYSVEPKQHTLRPDDDEAVIIKEIFDLYTNRRLGTRAIASHLNQRELHRRRGQPWSHKTVADVLVNRVYLGEIHFRGVVATAAHDALVDPATFDLADQILTQRGENPASKATASSEYHLTGKMTCPTCGRRYLGTNAVGRSRTYRYYTCFTRSRYGVDQCAAPRIDADALDRKVLDSLADFYANKLDLAREAIAAVRAQHLRARAGHERELATLSEQLANREAVVDRYLTDYENNTIDRDTVARRIDKISEEIRQLRYRRDEVAYLLDASADEPDGTHLIQLRDRVTEIINTGAAPTRKAICEALIAEVRFNGSATVTPVFRVPLTSADARAILGTSLRTNEKKAVRERPPSVGRTGLEPVTDRL